MIWLISIVLYRQKVVTLVIWTKINPNHLSCFLPDWLRNGNFILHDSEKKYLWRRRRRCFRFSLDWQEVLANQISDQRWHSQSDVGAFLISKDTFAVFPAGPDETDTLVYWSQLLFETFHWTWECPRSAN